MKRLYLVAIVCAVLSLGAFAQANRAATQSAASKSSAELRKESFEIVWTTIRDKHFDPTLGGVDWNKVKEQYEPRVAAVKSDEEFYRLLQQMLGELGQSHFNIIPPEAVAEETKDPSTGRIGINAAFVEGQVTVTSVEGGSPAERAGLRPGFIIKQVDVLAMDDLVERVKKADKSASRLPGLVTRAALARINGKPGTSVRISYLDERNQPHEAVIGREMFKGEMSPAFGNFPPQQTEFEAKRLAGGIGYIRFNIFVMSQMEKIRAAIRSMSDAPGIIFDVRDNPGGIGGMSSGIAGNLETRQISIGTMHMRGGHQNFVIFPQKDPYLGPVVILQNSGSASTSELFAAGLQDIGRAVIVGERSMGAALPSVIQKLPTGALFQYALGDFKTPKGVLVEGRGVVPDVEVKHTRRALLEGRDLQLEAAIEQIKKRAASANNR